MDENKIRQIVREELSRQDVSGRFKVQNIPYHTHDGVNSVILPPFSVKGINALSSNEQGVMGKNFAIGNVLINPILSNGAAYNLQTPTLSSEGLNGFTGGTAPIGTTIYFQNPTIVDGYWIFVNFSDAEGGDWHGIQLTVTP